VKRHLIAAALLLFSAAPCLASPGLFDLRAERATGSVVVSLQLKDAIDAARLEEIETGIESTVRYRVRLLRRRSGLLADEELADVEIEACVRRDALSRQYTLTRRLDGDTVEKRMTADPEEMRRFLTVLDHVPIASADLVAAAGEYEVRARGDLGLVWRFYMIPWPSTTGWVRVPLPPEEKERDGGDRTP
jgi:hypothetical protein